MDSIRNETKICSTANLGTLVCFFILMIVVLVGTADQAQATGLMFYALEDGQVRGFDIVTGTDSITVPASALFGSPPNPATGRNIAYDPATDLM